MDIDTLYPLVTDAIRRAEVLEELNAPGARDAYLDVSLLEERIARLLPPSNQEGMIARRGAVNAAIAARAYDRARQLVARYAAEHGVGHDLAAELAEFDARAAALADRPATVEGLPAHPPARHRGEQVSSADAGGHVVSQPHETPGLTGREQDIVRGLIEGKSNRAIAHRLGVAEQTVRSHVRNIMRKMAHTEPTGGALATDRFVDAIVRELRLSGEFTVPSLGTFVVSSATGRRSNDHRHDDPGNPGTGKTIRFEPSPALTKAV
jgi:DNA-binding CsgD family transcriptional regulator